MKKHTVLPITFYSILKNEDAKPYVGDNLLVVADGLGGSGSAVHNIDRDKHPDLRRDIYETAFYDMHDVSPKLKQFIEELIEPMTDEIDDTSALWASKIALARCVYALFEGDYKDIDLKEEKKREALAEYIRRGLDTTADKFKLQTIRRSEQLLLPTTLAFIRYKEKADNVIAEVVWAGDSRCYALTRDGLKLLSIDDEDASGAITNLFYAGNKKARLNYKRYEIAKPCVLMAVSDGVFDPFEPHDHLGVEHVLLSAIAKTTSETELAEELKNLYDKLHCDDATMAFVPIGFSDYADLKAKLAARTEIIKAVYQKKADSYMELEAQNLSEEEATHYVISRTSDKYEHIAKVLLDMFSRGESDIALTDDIRRIADDSKKAYKEEMAKVRKENLGKALSDFDEFVRKHPELVFSQILNTTADGKLLNSFYDDFKKTTDSLVAYNRMLDKLEKQAEDEKSQCRELHDRIAAIIAHYNSRLEVMWSYDVPHDEERQFINDADRLCDWISVDTALRFSSQIDDRVQKIIKKLMSEDKDLATEVWDYFNGRNKGKKEKSKSNQENKRRLNQYLTAWSSIYECFKKSYSLIFTLLRPEAIKQFKFDNLDAPIQLPLDRAMRELLDNKAQILQGIVQSLKKNYDKTSVLDSQYNATKLALFRTFYSLKAHPESDLVAFEAQLRALENEYTSLLQ